MMSQPGYGLAQIRQRLAGGIEYRRIGGLDQPGRQPRFGARDAHQIVLSAARVVDRSAHARHDVRETGQIQWSAGQIVRDTAQELGRGGPRGRGEIGCNEAHPP